MFNWECNVECLQPEVPVATQQYHEKSCLQYIQSLLQVLFCHVVTQHIPWEFILECCVCLFQSHSAAVCALFSAGLFYFFPPTDWGARLPQHREAFYRMLDFWRVGMKGRRYTTPLGCDFFTADAERLNKNRRDSYQLSLCLFLCHPRHHLLPHRSPVSPPPMPYLFIYNLTFPSPFFCRCNLINNLNVISVKILADPKVLKSCKRGDKTFFLIYHMEAV